MVDVLSDLGDMNSNYPDLLKNMDLRPPINFNFMHFQTNKILGTNANYHILKLIYVTNPATVHCPK